MRLRFFNFGISGLLIAITTIFTIIFQLIYRATIHDLTINAYALFNSLSFPYYLITAMSSDVTLIALISIVLIPLSFILRNKPMGLMAIHGTMLLIISNALWSAIEFFRVYETTFQTNFLTSENKSGIFELIQSSISEASASFWYKSLITTLIIILTLALIYYFYNEIEKHITKIASGVSIIIVLMIAISGISSLIHDDSSFIASLTKKNKKKYTSTYKELKGNPLLNVLIGGDESQKTTISYDKNIQNFPMNTSSLISQKRHGRINIIPRKKKYNIILYYFESTPMKYMNMKVNNKAVVPNWLRLSKNSIYFKNHYANYPLSASALFSTLTSCYALNTRDHVIQKHPRISVDTISQILKKQGYRTYLIHTGGLGYAGQKRFLKYRSFDRIIDYKELKRISEKKYRKKVGWGLDERTMIKPAVKLAQKESDKPFFMILMPVNPHHPYAIPHKKFRITKPVLKKYGFKKMSYMNYINSLHYADAAMGQLVNTMEQKGVMDNTLLFLFADHGEAFYQHEGNYNHPFYLYEENVHVPLLIYNKKLIKKQLVINAVTRHIDIAPTILDIIGMKPYHSHEGISMLKSRRAQMAFLHTYWKDDYLAIRDQQWKYIRKMKDGSEELYNLNNDSGEKKNLAEDLPEITKLYRQYILFGRSYQIAFYKKMLKKN